MDIILWCLAFLGLIIIWAAKPLVQRTAGQDSLERNIYIVKTIGIIISVIAMIILYKLGRFI